MNLQRIIIVFTCLCLFSCKAPQFQSRKYTDGSFREVASKIKPPEKHTTEKIAETGEPATVAKNRTIQGLTEPALVVAHTKTEKALVIAKEEKALAGQQLQNKKSAKKFVLKNSPAGADSMRIMALKRQIEELKRLEEVQDNLNRWGWCFSNFTLLYLIWAIPSVFIYIRRWQKARSIEAQINYLGVENFQEEARYIHDLKNRLRGQMIASLIGVAILMLAIIVIIAIYFLQG